MNLAAGVLRVDLLASDPGQLSTCATVAIDDARVIIAQARMKGLQIVSPDPAFPACGVPLVW